MIFYSNYYIKKEAVTAIVVTEKELTLQPDQYVLLTYDT